MFVGFRLRPGKDDDLIEWIENIEKDRSYYIREALRGKVKQKKASAPKEVTAAPISFPSDPVVSDEGLEANLDGWM